MRLKQTVSAKELFKTFLKTIVETGMPYVFFRDTVNKLNPNSHK
jgi:ribonucleoside-diphosphate reductase alpha chain